MAAADYFSQVQKIYVAYYGRPADPAGLSYWGSRLDAAGGDLSSIINAFGTSSESTALYTGDNSAKVTAIYQQLFNRAPDTAGLNFYTGELTAGRMTAASIALNVANGASGTDATYLSNKLTVASAFTDALNVDSAAAVAYAGTSAATSARSLISGVTTSAATTNVASTVSSIKSGGGAAAGQTFTLTTGTDIPALTLGNDIVNATANGTLASADIVVDRSTTDSDVLNATVNVSSGVAPRIQNVETVNISGQYAATSLALTNVLGTQTLNLNTGLAGGTATVTDASSINAVNVKAGANVSTLSVTSSAAGTRDTVFVDAGSASSVTAAGNTAADLFDVKLATGASATVNGGTSIDAYTLHLGATASIEGNVATEEIKIDSSAASIVTVTSGSGTAVALDSSTGTNQITLQGSNAITLKGTTAMFDDVRVQDSSNAVTTLWVTTISDNSVDFTGAEVDVVRVGAASTDNATVISVYEGSSVLLTSDATGANDVTFGLGATATGATDAAAYSGGTTGTLMLNVAQTQSATKAVKTASNVGTLLISAAPDEASDTANAAVITVGKLTLDAATTTAVATGSDNLTISTLTIGAASVFSGAGMTGKLNIGTTAGAYRSTITGGTGNDTIAIATGIANASALLGGDGADTISGGDGADTLSGGNGNDSLTGGIGADTVYGDAGNDTIAGGADADSIFGGDGDDSITGGADADTITGGAGADIFVVGASDGSDNIRDFVVGTDRIQLTGAVVTGDFDVTNVSVSSGVYTLGTVTPTLFGNTATNLANSIQLGKSSSLFTVAAGKTIVGGDFADSISRALADKSVTVTGGGGADVFYVQADNTSDASNDMTVTDFTVGTDKVVLTGNDVGAINLLTTVGSNGVFDVAGSSNNIFQFTLTGVADTVTAANIVQLGDSSNAFTVTGVKTTITGGNFADWITSGSSNDHTINGGLGADRIILGSGNETVGYGEGDSTATGYDQIRGGLTTGAAGDTLDLAGTATVATGLGSTAVGSIASATISNGIVTFKNAAGASIASSSLVLTDALGFLAANLVGARDTVAFVYKVDLNGNGGFTANNNPDASAGDINEVSTFVYQNGTVDTVIEIMGIESITAVSTSIATNTLKIA